MTYEEFGRQEREGWSDPSIADAYKDCFGAVTRGVEERLLRTAEPIPGRRVLDLCCGHGDLTSALAAQGFDVTGLDFSPAMLERARTGCETAEFVEGDAQNLPFGDGSFDVVLCSFGMMHLPDQTRALAEVRRVLHPGGRFAMATWAAPEENPAFAVVLGAIRAHADLSVAPEQPDLFAFTRREQAGAMMADAGLELTDFGLDGHALVMQRPGDMFRMFADGTVGISMLLRAQSEERLAAIRDAMTEAVAKDWAEEGAYRVPLNANILGARPA